MKMKNMHCVLMVCVCIGLIIASSAAVSDGHYNARDLANRGDIKSLESILDNVKLEYAGKVIEVELEKESGRYIYEFELLSPSGLVIELEYDAQTGVLLRAEAED